MAYASHPILCCNESAIEAASQSGITARVWNVYAIRLDEMSACDFPFTVQAEAGSHSEAE